MRRIQHGFSAVEVMIATVLLGLGICPILTLVMGTSREAGFTEAHMLVQARAFSLLDCQEALGFDTLDLAWEKSGRQPSLDLPVPAAAPEAPALARETGGNGYSEKLTFQRTADDLGLLTVEISWTLGTDQGKTRRPHVFRAFRILGRPDGSWQHSIALPVTPPAAAD